MKKGFVVLSLILILTGASSKANAQQYLDSSTELAFELNYLQFPSVIVMYRSDWASFKYTDEWRVLVKAMKREYKSIGYYVVDVKDETEFFHDEFGWYGRGWSNFPPLICIAYPDPTKGIWVKELYDFPEKTS